MQGVLGWPEMVFGIALGWPWMIFGFAKCHSIVSLSLFILVSFC
jgi:hypothetical protein